MSDPEDKSGEVEVVEWLQSKAVPLPTLEPGDDLDSPDQLGTLDAIVGEAHVVGLGGSSRLTHELSAVKHRILRQLVEHQGFRVLALELPGPAGQALDAYVQGGEGDLEAALARAQPFWQLAEVADVFRWARWYAAAHPDDRLWVVGADPDIEAPAEGPIAERIRRADPGLAAAPEALAYAERYLAESIISWYELTGDKIVYWGGTAHVAVGDRRVASAPPAPPAVERNAGSYLRQRFGDDYVTIGLTFDHGAAPFPVPPASPELLDSVLGRAGLDAYLIDLAADPDPPLAVAGWLNGPARARLIGPRYDPDRDAEYHMAGGSLAGWFDGLVHVQEVTAAHFLDPPP